MLDQLLEDIALKLGLDFQLGNLYDLENYSLNVKDDAPLIFFYDCYQTNKIKIDQKAGSKLKDFPLSIYILSPSDLRDETKKRLAQIRACESKADKIYAVLDEFFSLSVGTIEPVVTATSRSLDGVRLSTLLTDHPKSTC